MRTTGAGPARGTWEHEGGGVLINQAIHAIDLLIWLAGMPVSVTARAGTLNHAIEVKDATLALLDYTERPPRADPGDDRGLPRLSRTAGVLWQPGQRGLPQGQARLEWHLADPAEDRVDEAEVSSGTAGPWTSLLPGIQRSSTISSPTARKRAPQVDGHAGRQSVALVEAIYRSAASGGTIELADLLV